jgi:hypothetical protein
LPIFFSFFLFSLPKGLEGARGKVVFFFLSFSFFVCWVCRNAKLRKKKKDKSQGGFSFSSNHPSLQFLIFIVLYVGERIEEG